MAQQSNEKLARSLLDPSGREVLWPVVFAGVKNIVRANNLNSDTLTCIKGWLKSNDSQLHIPLLGLTVLHTISLNCSTTVRNQMVALKLLQRMEKQLVRPQGPQVATAVVQLLVDWAYLFGQEELGARCQALLDQPRFRQMAAGCGPSPAVLAMQEELQLGLPPVAPVRGEDFIRWMYRGASFPDRTPGLVAGNSGGGGGGTAFPDWPSVLSGGLPGGAPPPISPPAVPELCKRMQADAQRMEGALAACRAAARTQRQGELTAAMDAAYREAERCSQWRRRVQDYTQHCDDPLGLSSLLAATDVINQALQHWQHFTGREVYDTLRIAVPPPSAEMLRRTATTTTTTTTAAAGGRPQGAAAVAGGRGSELADLLGMGHVTTSTASTTAVTAPQPRQPQPPAGGSGNPFGPARPPLAGPSQAPAASNNPFAVLARPAGLSGLAEAAPQPSRTAATGPPAFDWDPFAPSPPAAVLGGAAAGGNSWTAFTQDPAVGGVPWTGPLSPNPTSPQPSGPILSPSAASAVSVASAASTPNGGGAASQPTASSPRQPPTGALSYLQHFRDLVDLVPPAATPPQQAATAAASVATNGSGSSGSRPAAVGAAASAAVATAAVAGASHMANGHAYTYPATGSAAAAAGAAATTAAIGGGGAGGGGLYPQVPAAGTSLAPSAAAAAAVHGVGNSGSFRSASSSADGTAAAPALDWHPEFERLASELRSLWATAAAAASPPAPPPSAASSSLAGGSLAAANGDGAAAAATLLPAVLARVRGLCESLAAQHARQVAALVAALQAASVPEAAAPPRDTVGGGSNSNGNGSSLPGKLRGGATASASAPAAAAATAGGAAAAATVGVGPQSAWSGSGAMAGAGPAGWVGFGAGARAAAMGPLQQHLVNQQQQQPQYLQQQQKQQQQQQLRTNGVAAGGGRDAASRESLI